MSDPVEYYRSLPPVTKAYGTLCVAVTVMSELQLINPWDLALSYHDVFSHFQVWRLITNFFCLGNFSYDFGMLLLMLGWYGVELERTRYRNRTADFLWMMLVGAFTLLALSAITYLWNPFLWNPSLGPSLVYMLLCVWSREFPHARKDIHGLFTIEAFYLPWTILGFEVIFGRPLLRGLLGIVAGHLCHLLTVSTTRRNLLETPRWLLQLVRRCRIGLQAP